VRLLNLSAAGATLALLALVPAIRAEPRTYAIDRAHSEVGFNIRHFFNKTHGRFEDYKGTIVFDPQSLKTSSVQVTIRDSSIYTANAKRDDHLRGQDFFWVEKYPTLTFASTKVIAGKDAEHFKVAGNLTIRDVTKPVVLDVEYLGMGPIGVNGNDLGTQAGFWATTKVNRKDYGIMWNRNLDQGGVMLGDDVEIVLSIAAVTPKPPASSAQPASAPSRGQASLADTTKK